MHYGEKMDFEIAKEAINKSISLLNELRIIFNSFLKLEKGKNDN